MNDILRWVLHWFSAPYILPGHVTMSVTPMSGAALTVTGQGGCALTVTGQGGAAFTITGAGT